MSFLKIGLTGAMGAGKSLAKAILQKRAFITLDADRLCHYIMENDPDTVAALKAGFGVEIYDAHGALIRDKLAAKVFAKCHGADGGLKKLEDIIHPTARTIWKAFCKDPCLFEGAYPQDVAFYPECGASKARGVAVEIPLLFEKNLAKDFDLCITVYCSYALRFERLSQRGMSAEQISSRDARQFPAEKKVLLADVVLFNESSPDFLEEQVALFVKFLEQCKKKTF